MRLRGPFQLQQLLLLDRWHRAIGSVTICAVNARITVRHQLFREVFTSDLNKSKIARKMTAAARVFLAGLDRERPRKLFPGETLRRQPDLDRLRDREMKIFRLSFHSTGDAVISFRSIGKVDPKDVFGAFGADMETVAIVRWIGEKDAVFVSHPIPFRARIFA